MTANPAAPPIEDRSRASQILATCRRLDLGWALVIGALGLVLRLAYAFQFAGHALGQRTWVDESAYWGQALEILRGQWLPSRPFTYAPLYPYVLAGLMAIFGPNVWALRIVSACVGSLTPLAIFWAGRTGLGRAEGIVAGLATAIYGPMIFYDAHLDKEVFVALGIALTLGLMAKAGRTDRGAWFSGLTGWIWGILALLRSHLMFLGPVGAAWWLLAIPGPLGRRVRRAGAYVVGFGLALAPVTLINAMVSNPTELILTSWVAGPNFYLGNGPEATGSFTPLSFILATPERESDDYVAEARRRTGRQLSLGEVSQYWMQQGLDRWRTDPGASVRLLVRKLAMLSNDFEIPDNHDLEIFRLVAAPALGWGILSFGWIAPWSALGLGRTDRTSFWWFLVLLTAGGLAATAIFFVVGRYRIPWIPGLMLLAAAGAVDTVRRAATGQWRALAWRVLLLAVPAAALAWQPPPNPFPDRWSHFQVELALAYLDAGQVDQTINALDDARAMGQRPMQWTAMMLESGQDHDHLEAVLMSHLETKTAGVPGLDEDLRRIRLLRQIPEGRAESRRLAETALRDHPDDARVHREWGAWWLGEARMRDPEALRAVRLRAAREFNQAAHGSAHGDSSAEILLALLTADPIHLDHAAQIGIDRDQPRIRYARAFLAAQHR
jgi:hypothetical protein